VPFTLLTMAKPGPRTPSSQTALGFAAIALAALLWAVAATVASDLFDSGVSPLELVQARAVIAAGGLAVVALVSRRGRPRRSGLAIFVVLGLSIALVNATYYVAIDRLSVAVAVVIQYTAPALVVAYTAARARRRPSRDVSLAVAGAVAGVLLVSELPAGDVGRLDGLGLLAAVGSAFLFATYTLLSERAAANHGTVEAMFRAFVVASAFWVVYQAPRGWPQDLVRASNLPEVLYIGVAGTLAPFLLFVWGIQRVRAERAAIAATLEPVLAAVIAWTWLSQTLSLMQILGGVLVLAAVLSLQARRRKPIRAPEP
jgi:DME family drug/metabolite transporter